MHSRRQMTGVFNHREIFYTKFWAKINEQTFFDTVNDIRHNLEFHGMDFEGRNLPVSIVPTILHLSELSQIKINSQIILKVLNRIISGFIENHRCGNLDSQFHRFFSPYYKWWDLIAKEHRVLPNIMLMRFDAIKDLNGTWKVMETNTSCPGGVIHCARIREAWMMTRLGYNSLKNEEVSTYGFDSPSFFVSKLVELAEKIDANNPNIAIVNYQGVYANELQSLKRCFYSLKEQGRIANGEFYILDATEITCANDQAFFESNPLALIYNKLDHLTIDPQDQALSGWIEAAKSTKTEFLNSLGAMYLSEAKRILAFLSDENWSYCLNLSDEESKAISEIIPETRLIEDTFMLFGGDFINRTKDQFVLKADSLTRGEGVHLGDSKSSTEWATNLENIRENHGVMQSRCAIPSRQGLRILDSRMNLVTEYYGYDIFMFNQEFSGIVSRSHTNEVFNIGNGGCESPVIIIGKKDDVTI